MELVTIQDRVMVDMGRMPLQHLLCLLVLFTTCTLVVRVPLLAGSTEEGLVEVLTVQVEMEDQTCVQP